MVSICKIFTSLRNLSTAFFISYVEMNLMPTKLTPQFRVFTHDMLCISLLGLYWETSSNFKPEWLPPFHVRKHNFVSCLVRTASEVSPPSLVLSLCVRIVSPWRTHAQALVLRTPRGEIKHWREGTFEENETEITSPGFGREFEPLELM